MPTTRELLSGVRDQGVRGTCLCMAMSDGHLVARGCPPALSVDYLHFKAASLAGVGVNSGVPEWAAIDALRALGQPAETDCPYWATHRDASWEPPVPSGPLWRHKAAWSEHHWERLEAAVAGGRPVVITLDIDDPFYDPVNGVVSQTEDPVRASHAVLAVDVAAAPPRVLVRNSWGPDWGDAGHAWLTADYLAARCTGIISFEGVEL